MELEKLTEILELHKNWLNEEEGGVRANLRYANLTGAALRRTDLRNGSLRHADLRYANLLDANLSGANLSGVKGILSPSDWLKENAIATTSEGYIFIKDMSGPHYGIPTSWKVEQGSVITEVVNFTRTQECGCGVNFGNEEYIKRHHSRGDLWTVLIRWEWLAGVCVPYNTDGKARCEKLELIAKFKPNNDDKR